MMRAVDLTNHGASLVAPVVVEDQAIWLETPVRIRWDVMEVAKGERLLEFADMDDLGLLASAMSYLSLKSADFNEIGDVLKLDAVVKRKVARHHFTWIMRPLTLLFDRLKARAKVAVSAVAGDKVKGLAPMSLVGAVCFGKQLVKDGKIVAQTTHEVHAAELAFALELLAKMRSNGRRVLKGGRAGR